MTDELLLALTQQLIPTIIALFVGLLLRQFVKMFNEYVPEILEVLRVWAGNTLSNQILGIVKAGVMAAEQGGLTGRILNEGRQKKAAALDYIKSELIRLKLDGLVPIDVIDQMIEATVYKELEHIRFLPLDEEPEPKSE